MISFLAPENLIKEARKKQINVSEICRLALENAIGLTKEKDMTDEEKLFLENKTKSERAYNLWYDQEKDKERMVKEQEMIAIDKELEAMRQEYNHYLDAGDADAAQQIKEKMIIKSKKRGGKDGTSGSDQGNSQD